MGNPSKAFAGATPVAMPFAPESTRPEDWRHARAEYLSLLLIGMPRVNLLLIGVDGLIWNVLGTLLLDLHEPIATWCPGQPFVLPPAGRIGTLILHDVGALTSRQSASSAEVARTGRRPVADRQHGIRTAPARGEGRDIS